MTVFSFFTSASNNQRLLTALIVITVFMIIEIIGGLISGSLALLADAGHMLTDAGGSSAGSHGCSFRQA
jgi:cobalt-zinc-cadmium efflux system protein